MSPCTRVPSHEGCADGKEEEPLDCEQWPVHPRRSLNSTCNGCSGIQSTYELSQCQCRGSAYSTVLLSVSASPGLAPLLVSWVNDLNRPGDIRSPMESTDVLLLESALSPPLPISGQRPCRYAIEQNKLRMCSCSALCLQRQNDSNFDILLLLWDNQCGYVYVNSGISWQRIDNQLMGMGESQFCTRVNNIRQLNGSGAKLTGSPWIMTVNIRSAPSSYCQDLSSRERRLLQNWIENGQVAS